MPRLVAASQGRDPGARGALPVLIPVYPTPTKKSILKVACPAHRGQTRNRSSSRRNAPPRDLTFRQIVKGKEKGYREGVLGFTKTVRCLPFL
jgi:hypothetical protein